MSTTMQTRLQARANTTVIAHFGTVDSRGKFTEIPASTVNLTNCRIEEGAKLISDITGREVVSMFQIHSMEHVGLWPGRNSDNEAWRFTLPSAQHPTAETQMEAKNVIKHWDDTEVLFEEIQL
jgi:hypothetical protein